MSDFGKIFDFGIFNLEIPTLVFGVVVFLIVVFFMNLWLFRPVLNNMREREKYIKNLNKEAESIQKKILDLQAEKTEKRKDFYADVEAIKSEAMQAEKQAAESLLEKARQQARAAQEQLNSEIAKELEKSLIEAKKVSTTYSAVLLKKLSHP